MSRLFLLLGLWLCISSSSAQEICNNPADAFVDKSMHSNFAYGQRNFTFSLMQAIRRATPNENTFFSPYSTYRALLLAYFGAGGHTLDELRHTLHLQWAGKKAHVNQLYNLEKSSRRSRAAKMPLTFSSADKMYFDTSVRLMDCAKQIYHDVISTLDFQRDPEGGRMEINNWIAEVTHDQIKNMLGSGDITADTQVVLANAAYFKGNWASQFDPLKTEKKPFYTAQNKTSLVDMMYKRGTYNLAADERLGAYVLEIPYLTSNSEEAEQRESQMSMIVLLPPQGHIEQMLDKLNAETLEEALRSTMAREVELYLPRFAFEQNLELVPILRHMGLNSMFDRGADMSDFSAINTISFGDAKHVAKIKVDEEGSTASAATVLFSFRSARPLEPTVFNCEVPFVFLIYDHSAKMVLFSGIYRDPMTQK